AVEDGNAGSQHALIGLDDELVARGGAHMQCQLVTLTRNLLYANALREASTVLVEFSDQSVQKRHRVELSLAGETDATVKREGDVGVVDPVHGQPRCLARLEFGARGGHTL